MLEKFWKKRRKQKEETDDEKQTSMDSKPNDASQSLELYINRECCD